jgi:hypothetical protein
MLHIYGRPMDTGAQQLCLSIPKHSEHILDAIDIDTVLINFPPKVHVDHNWHGCVALLDVLWQI